MDLTGKRFGRLLVLRRADAPYISPSGKSVPRWVCRCDCGNEVTVLQNALTARANGTRSCGCSRRDSARAGRKSMEGQRFGRLVVVAPAELPKPAANGQLLGWRCRCDCGSEVIASRKDLLSGKLLSCGCLLRDTGRKKITVDNVTGFYGGSLVSAIKPERPPNKNNRSGVKGVYWSPGEARWIAKIGVRGKAITLGRFASLEAAAQARRAAEEKYFSPLIADYGRGKK